MQNASPISTKSNKLLKVGDGQGRLSPWPRLGQPQPAETEDAVATQEAAICCQFGVLERG